MILIIFFVVSCLFLLEVNAFRPCRLQNKNTYTSLHMTTTGSNIIKSIQTNIGWNRSEKGTFYFIIIHYYCHIYLFYIVLSYIFINLYLFHYYIRLNHGQHGLWSFQISMVLEDSNDSSSLIFLSWRRTRCFYCLLLGPSDELLLIVYDTWPKFHQNTLLKNLFYFQVLQTT